VSNSGRIGAIPGAHLLKAQIFLSNLLSFVREIARKLDFLADYEH